MQNLIGSASRGLRNQPDFTTEGRFLLNFLSKISLGYMESPQSVISLEILKHCLAHRPKCQFTPGKIFYSFLVSLDNFTALSLKDYNVQGKGHASAFPHADGAALIYRRYSLHLRKLFQKLHLCCHENLLCLKELS